MKFAPVFALCVASANAFTAPSMTFALGKKAPVKKAAPAATKAVAKKVVAPVKKAVAPPAKKVVAKAAAPVKKVVAKAAPIKKAVVAPVKKVVAKAVPVVKKAVPVVKKAVAAPVRKAAPAPVRKPVFSRGVSSIYLRIVKRDRLSQVPALSHTCQHSILLLTIIAIDRHSSIHCHSR
jgi:hypothetical protein